MLKLDQIGNVIGANLKYAEKNQGFSTFLVNSYLKLIKVEYPKVCSVPFEKSVDKIRMEIAHEVDKTCVKLPTMGEIQKCAEKLEDAHPVIWENKLMQVLVANQLQQKQAEMQMAEMAKAMRGGEGGEAEGGSIPSDTPHQPSMFT